MELIPYQADQQAFLKCLRQFFIAPKVITPYLIDRYEKSGEAPGFYFETLTFCFTCMQPRFRDRVRLPLMRILTARPGLGVKIMKLIRWMSRKRTHIQVDVDLHRGF